MFETSSLSLFLVAAVLLAVTPGPAVLYIVTRSVTQGKGAGLASCLGVAVGGVAHVLAATFGLSALLASSAPAFSVVKYAGAAYLAWLGYRKLTQAPALDPEAPTEKHSRVRVFHEGVLVNVLNPKTALFFLAFLPQFVVPSRGGLTLQFAFLGSLFIVVALCTDTAWCLLAGTIGGWLKRNPRFASSERYVAGSVYLGLGFATALSGNGRK
jgi:threonine/homoserine/homoserine lactone efflux protein